MRDMDYKPRESASVFIVFMLFLLAFISGSGQVVQGFEEQAERKPSVSDVVRSLFSTVSTSASARSSNYRDKIKTLMNQAQAYFFPPNLDFREREDEAKELGSGGERVKEAVAKSLEKSRTTLEDSAKSAAKIAGEVIHKTKDKVKKTLSHTHNEL